MKNKILLISSLSILLSLSAGAQTWTTMGTDKLYVSPTSTYVGIGTLLPTARLHVAGGPLLIGPSLPPALFPSQTVDYKLLFGDSNVQIGEWEEDNKLSLQASKFNFLTGNVGVGVSNPQYKLDVNGKLFLHTYHWQNATAYSYLNWQALTLVMGVPVGEYSVTKVDIKSGGYNGDSLYSQLMLYTAYGENNQVPKIKFNTMEHCWINTTGYVGIGTESPRDKLDVRGTVRADAVIVYEVDGADYVFDESYKLRPLDEVQRYIQENQHLPEIPSANEMQENGVNMNELQMQLLQKVEELTLYIIQQENRIKELEEQLNK